MKENSIIKNNIINKKEKLHLPKIDLKLVPNQIDINDISQNENEEEEENIVNLRDIFNNLKIIKSQTFLTSKLTETQRNNEKKSRNIFNNDAIIDLLKEKIEINPFLSNKNIFMNKLPKHNKKSENKQKKKLNRYINENILLNSPIKIQMINKKKLKHIKMTNIFNEEDEDEKDKNDDDSNYDKSLYNLRLYNYLKETEEAKKVKSVNKKIIKKQEMESVKNDWRKNINCSLQFKYFVNKGNITNLNSKINSMNKRSKIYFDTQRNESNDMLEQIWIN